MWVWFMVAGYAVLSGLVASFSRAGYGAQQAVSSRYIAFAVYLPVALVNLVAIIAADQRSRPNRGDGFWIRLPACLAMVLVLLHLLALPAAIHESWETRFNRRQGKAALLMADVLPDNPGISELVGGRDEVIPEANVLNNMGYLRPPLVRTNDASQIIAADAGGNAPVIGGLDACATDQKGQINVVGWAINRRVKDLADGVLLTYDDPGGKPIIFIASQMNLQREDLLQQNGDPIYEWCGWRVSFLPSEVPAEIKTTRISAWALDVDSGRVYRLRGGCMFKR
jgi:hypothetical protein